MRSGRTSCAPAAGWLRISATLLDGQRPRLAEHLRPQLDLADVVERRGPAKRADPLAIPTEPQRDRLGERRDAVAVAELVWSRCSSARAIETSMPGRIPRRTRDSYPFQIPPIGVPVREKTSRGRPQASSIVRSKP